jgi:hypothetical protein
MTINPDQPAKEPSFLAKSKKAVAGGIAGAATALVTTVPSAVGDGVFTQAEFWFVATTTVGAFVVGFATVWVAPANA